MMRHYNNIHSNQYLSVVLLIGGFFVSIVSLLSSPFFVSHESINVQVHLFFRNELNVVVGEFVVSCGLGSTNLVSEGLSLSGIGCVSGSDIGGLSGFKLLLGGNNVRCNLFMRTERFVSFVIISTVLV